MKVEKIVVNRKFGVLDIIIFLAIVSVLYLKKYMHLVQKN